MFARVVLCQALQTSKQHTVTYNCLSSAKEMHLLKSCLLLCCFTGYIQYICNMYKHGQHHTHYPIFLLETNILVYHFTAILFVLLGKQAPQLIFAPNIACVSSIVGIYMQPLNQSHSQARSHDFEGAGLGGLLPPSLSWICASPQSYILLLQLE